MEGGIFVEELEERDIDFEELKSNVYNVDKVNEKYQFFIIA